MRELAFTLRYGDGVDPLMDLFQRQPSLRANAVGAPVGRDRFWLAEQFAGPDAALDEAEAIRCPSDATGVSESAGEATRETSVLERSPGSLVTYVFLEHLHTCESVYALAARRLERGCVVRSRRRDDTHEMRVLTRSGENVEAFYERLRETLPAGISLEFGHLNGVSQWEFDSLASVTLPREQRETLRAAIEHGYYETPRGITVGDLADRLDVPQSTVSYRLRQAEARLAKGYFGLNDTVEEEPRAAR